MPHFTCYECNISFDDVKSLANHKRNHKPLICCPLCDYRSTRTDKLSEHISAKHAEADEFEIREKLFEGKPVAIRSVPPPPAGYNDYSNSITPVPMSESSTPYRSTATGVSTSSKVAEIFLTAGTAFNKLGELTLELNSAVENQEETKWTEREIAMLEDSVERFANDLNRLTDHMKTRTINHIRLDMKRRSYTESGIASPTPTKRRYAPPSSQNVITPSWGTPVFIEEDNDEGGGKRQHLVVQANTKLQYASLPGGLRTIVVRDAPASLPQGTPEVRRSAKSEFVDQDPVAKGMLLAKNLVASSGGVGHRDPFDSEERVLEEMEDYFQEEAGIFATS